MIKFPSHILEDMKKHLEGEKVKVSAQVADLAAQDPFADTSRLNDNAATDTEASEEVDHERFQAMILELNKRLKDIEGALERIKNGTYGLCVMCNQLIDTERLAAMPTATLCMTCEREKAR